MEKPFTIVFEMKPLDHGVIVNSYRNIFQLDLLHVKVLADLTKGYSYAIL